MSQLGNGVLSRIVGVRSLHIPGLTVRAFTNVTVDDFRDLVTPVRLRPMVGLVHHRESRTTTLQRRRVRRHRLNLPRPTISKLNNRFTNINTMLGNKRRLDQHSPDGIQCVNRLMNSRRCDLNPRCRNWYRNREPVLVEMGEPARPNKLDNAKSGEERRFTPITTP